MSLFAALLLLSSQATAAETTYDPVELATAEGDYVARVEKAAGQERVPDQLARWILSVTAFEDGVELGELWSCHYSHSDGPRLLTLSEDGAVFVVLEEIYQAGRPVVRVFESGREVASVSGAQLRPGREDLVEGPGGRRWLIASGGPSQLRWELTAMGPVRVLDVVLRGGETRTISWSGGVQIRSGEAPAPPLPRVEPHANPNALSKAELPYVDSAEARAVTRVGEDFAIRIRGHFPTPGWQLFGFSVEYSPEGDVVIVPCAVPPRSGGLSAQVLTSYVSLVTVRGLPAGQQRIVVRGRAEGTPVAVDVEVLPFGLTLELRVSGGLGEPDSVTRLYAQGILERDGEYRTLSREATAELGRLAAALLDDAPRASEEEPGAEGLRYEFGRWHDGAWRVRTFDAGDLPPSALGLLERLR